jgi:hypothetical protein
MSQKVQSGAPQESRVAFYMLMGLLGIAFLGVAAITFYLFLQ